MHELSLVEQLLEQSRQHAQGRRIQTVHVRVGAMTCVDPEALHFCFQACCGEAGMAAAELQVVVEPAHAACRRCGKTFTAVALPVICTCGSSDCSLDGGQDVVLMALDLAVEERN